MSVLELWASHDREVLAAAVQVAYENGDGGGGDQAPASRVCVLKKGWKKSKELANLLSHIDKGCLSDEPNVDLYYTNMTNGSLFCARGSNQSELLHKQINRMLRNYSTIGPE
jgi:hypothetical protein